MKHMNCFSISTAILLVLIENASATDTTVEYQVGTTRITGLKIDYRGKEIHLFKRIPFAKPPIGNLRFKAPQELDLSTLECINGTAEMTACVQEKQTMFPNTDITEDCLHLMVHVSSKVKQDFDESGKKVPVVVIFYGGGFVSGSAGFFFNDGQALSSENLVVVGFNYRLGLLGFMDNNTEDVPGNMGLMDQQLALRWIQKYIHYFGGDPEFMTLIGVSAGSVSIGGHIVNDESRKLFKSVVMDGGSIAAQPLMEHYKNTLDQNRRIAMFAGCKDAINPDDIYHCLMNKTPEEIVSAQKKFAEMDVSAVFLTYGSKFFPEDPKIAITKLKSNLPKILIGTAKFEGSIFTSKFNPEIYPPKNMSAAAAQLCISQLERLYRLRPHGDTYQYARLGGQGMIDVITDGLFVCPVLQFVDQMSLHGAHVFVYQMNYFLSDTLMKTPHAYHSMGFLFQLGLPLSVFSSFTSICEKEVAKRFVGVVTDIAGSQRKISPRYGNLPLAYYNPGRRLINVVSESGILHIQEGHDRDSMCMQIWNYTIPYPKFQRAITAVNP